MKKTILSALALALVCVGCSSDDDAQVVTGPSIQINDLSTLTIDENSNNGTIIATITANVQGTTTVPVYSIVNQSPAGAVSIVENTIVIADASIFDYETTTEITGQITGSLGDVSETVAFSIAVTNIDEVLYFPDEAFKAALLENEAINTNGNDEIEESEAANFTGSIVAPARAIQDATGIHYFVNATGISLYQNNLTTIDVSSNTKVTQLLLEHNSLTSIDISNLTDLTDFKCHSNALTEANLANGNNANMTRMEIQTNIYLPCIKVDALPVPTTGWIKDGDATYSTDCL